MGSPAENKAAVKAAYEGMASGDPSAFLGLLGPDFVLHEPDPLPYGGSFQGTDQIISFMQKAAAVIDGSTLEIESLVAEDDHVIAVLRAGIHEGGEAELVEHWHFDGDKATELRVYWFDPTKAAAPA